MVHCDWRGQYMSNAKTAPFQEGGLAASEWVFESLMERVVTCAELPIKHANRPGAAGAKADGPRTAQLRHKNQQNYIGT